MWGWLAVKALVSGVIVAAASEIARRYPGFGGLVASLPLVSVLGMLWLWHDRLLRGGMNFHLALLLGCLLTIVLYVGMIALAPKVGIRL